jgi:rhamnosyltransferase subunit B
VPAPPRPQAVLVTQGTAGDVLPFAALARELVGLGCRTSVITHNPYRQLVEHCGAAFVPNDLPGQYEHYLSAMGAMLDLRPANLVDFYEDAGLFGLFEAELSALVDICDANSVIVGHHTCALSARVGSEITGARYASMVLEPSHFGAAAATGIFFGKGVGGRLNEYRSRYGLGQVVKWGTWLAQASLVGAMWPPWFDRAGTPSPEAALLAGFPYGDELMPRLPGSEGGEAATPPRPPVVISGGTSRLLNPEFYDAAVAGIAEAGLEATVVAPWPELVPELPPGFAVKTATSQGWLDGARLVVHAGGIGTVARATRDRVPQLVLADGVGRPDNANRVQAAGIGVRLLAKDWSSRTVANAALACIRLQPKWPQEQSPVANAARLVAQRCIELCASSPE